MLPSLFIAHGSPQLAIEKSDYTNDLLQLGRGLGGVEAIVVFSAHWVSRNVSLTYSDESMETMYDFGGFPQELYDVVYPASGSIQVSEEVAKLLEGSGIEVNRNTRRGLDHGVWVILSHMYPEANIPVIAVSVNPILSPEEQYRIGQTIAALKERNIVVIGSGGTVHNLRTIDFHSEEHVDEWAKEFDNWLIEHLRKWDITSLFDYKRLAPHSALATPDYEHFLPLFIAMGCGDGSRKVELLHQSYKYGSLSHLILQFD